MAGRVDQCFGSQPPGDRWRVLVVEDEPDIANLLVHGLERGGHFEVAVAESGEAALNAVATRTPDLLILDLTLPSLDGVAVCRILRDRPATVDLPIIMLTARDSERAMVVGLDSGADDYVTKPFSLVEVEARARAVLRRRHAASPERYRGAHLVADFDAWTVSIDGRPVRLTRREFELLRCLVKNWNRVLSRDRLLERVWGYVSSVETRSIDVHVGRLRRKLGPTGRQIETVVGLGYRFVE